MEEDDDDNAKYSESAVPTIFGENKQKRGSDDFDTADWNWQNCTNYKAASHPLPKMQ